jgi:DNA-nicking Smr family endonuclease
MAKKLIVLTEDDKKVFADAMRGVRPLIQSKIQEPSQRSTQSRKIKRQDIDQEEMTYLFSDYEKLDLAGPEEKLEFYRSGLQYKIIRNLRKGQYNVEAVLDLHGKTIEEARHSLSHFLLSCQQKGIRHVIIIHGKGRSHSKPIIKNKLNHWLREIDQVLAFCTATPHDGGGGALYVLLRRE